MATSRFQGRWVPRSGGAFSIEEALEFVRSRGVKIPRYIAWYVAEHEGLTLEECGLASADAMYYRSDQTGATADFLIRWDDLTIRGRVPVWIREEVLRSEDHSLYVCSHEVFEIRQLKRAIAHAGGSISLRRLCSLIDPAYNGAIHHDAVRYSDRLVEKFRREREGSS